ncbi:MAG TPA: hypothetical protein VF395_05305 [Polyangiaceae bacterium]
MRNLIVPRVLAFGPTLLLVGCVTVQVPEPRDVGPRSGASTTETSDSGTLPTNGVAFASNQGDSVVGPDAMVPPDYRGPPVPFCAGRVTTWLRITANLDASAAIAPPFDLRQPAQTATRSLSVVVWASPGVGGQVDVFFSRISDTSYQYHAVIGGSKYEIEIGQGTLGFTSNGALYSLTEQIPLEIPVPGALPRRLKLIFGTPILAGGTGLDGVTSFDSPFNVSGQAQDGCAAVLGNVCPEAPLP